MKKCVFCTIVAIVLSLSCVWAATEFTDVSNNFWAKDNINNLVKIGVVNGYPDGTFRPNNSITRAEFAKIMSSSLGLTYLGNTNQTFKDVTADKWEYPYVEGIKDYLTGYKDIYNNMYFRSNDIAVREDIAVALVKSLGYDNLSVDESDIYNVFSDASEISSELKKYVLIAYNKQLIKGYEDGTFRPQGQLTRAEVAALITRVLDSKGGIDRVLPEFIYNSQTKSIDLGANYNLYEYSYSTTVNPRSWYQADSKILYVSNFNANYVFIRYKSTYDNYAIVNINDKTTMYTIKYDANGGNGVPASQSKIQGQALILSNTKPERNGYKFIGWSLYATSTTGSYQPGDRYTNDASVTLYAIWEKAVTYRVTYNATWGTGAPNLQNKVKGETLVISSTIPTREGYTFKGWSTGISSDVIAYLPGDKYTNDANITLYAVWEQGTTTPVVPGQTTYTIKYDANGGSGAPSNQTKIHDEDLVLRTAIPTRSGYTFLGWSTSKSATSATYSPGGIYANNASLTLFAVWQLQSTTNPSEQTYTIRYDANGGSGAPSSQTGARGQAIYLSNTRPTRSGYTFLGWSTNSSATTPMYQPNSIFAVTSNTTLYAVWQSNQSQIQICTISYDANGGSGAPYNQTKELGKVLTISGTIPTRSGYTFLGWSSSSSATTPSYTSGSTMTVTGNLTLYAVWQSSGSTQPPVNPTQTYTITYYANGGSGAPSTQTKQQGQTIYLSSTRPTRSGYTFLGWSTSSSATSSTYSPGTLYSNDSNLSLYAVWQSSGSTQPPVNPTQTYTIRYFANGGSGAPSSQTKTTGQTIYLSSTRPTRSGYTFLGWDYASRATTPAYQPGQTYTANASVDLYAVWQQTVTTYTITYDANGGSGAPSTQTKNAGQTIYISSTKPTRSGYVFDGWKQISPYTGQIYLPGVSFTDNQSVTLQAIWKTAATYTITYDLNGGHSGPSNQTKKAGETIYISSVVPKKLGYVFDGWKQISPYTGRIYPTGGYAITDDQSITLQAIWKSANSSSSDGYH